MLQRMLLLLVLAHRQLKAKSLWAHITVEVCRIRLFGHAPLVLLQVVEQRKLDVAEITVVPNFVVHVLHVVAQRLQTFEFEVTLLAVKPLALVLYLDVHLQCDGEGCGE